MRLPNPLQDANTAALKRLLACLKGYRRTLFLGCFCTAAASALTLSVAKLLDVCVKSLEPRDLRTFVLAIALVVPIYAAKGLFTYGQTYFIAAVTNGLGARLRGDIYAHIQRMPLSFFERNKTGHLMSRAMSDVGLIQAGAASVVDAIAGPLTMIGGIGYMFFVSWQLTLIAIVFVALMLLAIDRVSRRIRSLQSSLQVKLADVSAAFEETVAGVRVVKSFGREDYEIGRFVDRNDQSLRAALRGVRRSAAVSPAVELVGAAAVSGIMLVGAVALRLDLGTILKFLYLANAVTNSAKHLGRLKVVYEQTMAGVERIVEVLDEHPDMIEKPNAVALPSGPGTVEFRSVCFGYGKGERALHDISFSMEPGEVVAIVGQSGAGKTTIANLIPRFYDVSEGAVVVDGMDVRDVTLESLRDRIAIVPQETILFSGTIRENIAYGKLDAADEEIEEAASAANADAFVRAFQDGYDTVVGERGTRLSGGERQRIAIARAILKDPRILILDEATSSLDVKSEGLVQSALEELMRSRTTLVIAHRLSTITRADKILVLSHGRIVESGGFQDLLGRGGPFAKLYEAQFQLQEVG